MKVEIHKDTYSDNITVIVIMSRVEAAHYNLGLGGQTMLAKRLGEWKPSQILQYFSNFAKKLEEADEQTREPTKP